MQKVDSSEHFACVANMFHMLAHIRVLFSSHRMALEGVFFRFAGMNDFCRGFVGGGWKMQNFANLLLKIFAYSKK